jgi:hypothetical protein
MVGGFRSLNDDPHDKFTGNVKALAGNRSQSRHMMAKSMFKEYGGTP